MMSRLSAFTHYTVYRPFLSQLFDPSIFTITSAGDRVLAFAQSQLNKTVRWQVQYYGNEQCTDLVLAALNSANAKTDADFGTVGNNGVDYIWGTLGLKRTVGTVGNSGPVTLVAVGTWSQLRPGDIFQFSNVKIVNPDGSWFTMGHHSAIVERNIGNGQVTVLEQNSNNHHYVERHTYNLAYMTQGTVWAYHPVAK